MPTIGRNLSKDLAPEKINKPNKLKFALLLNDTGNECIDTFNRFKLPTENANKFDIVIDHFQNYYFEMKKNTVFARYKFFNCVKEKKIYESVHSFVTSFKNLVKDCYVENQEEGLIRYFLIIGIRYLAAKEKFLIDIDLNLIKVV